MFQIFRDRWLFSGATRSVSMSWSCDRSLFVAPYREMNSLEFQRFLVQFRFFVFPLVLPGADVGEIGIITHGFTVRELVFSPEMASARLFTVQGIASKQFTEFKEVGDSTGVFQ